MMTRTITKASPLGVAVLLLLTVLPLTFFIPISGGTVQVKYDNGRLTAHQEPVNSVCWAPNSTEVVSGGDDDTARIWKWNHTVERTPFEGHSYHVLAVDWSPDGNKIVSGDASGRVKYWSAKNGNTIDTFIGHYHADFDRSVYDVDWDSSSRKVVSCGNDNNGRVFNTETSVEITSFGGHGDVVNSVDWSADETKIVSGGNDNRVRIWGSSSGTEVDFSPLTGHYMSVNSVAWSPDGAKIVSGSDDNTARIWDATTGNELLQFTGHSGSVLGVDWSPDSTKVVSCSTDNTIKIWDASNGYEYVNFSGHNNVVRCVDWSPNGEMIVSGSDDGRASLWFLKAPPSIPKLYIPDNDVIRGKTITISGEAEAYFTPTEQLTAEFQYKHNADTEWTKEELTAPAFNNSKWEVDFTPTYSNPTGFYDFRVQFQELNGLLSPWTTTSGPGRVKVLNNAPSIVISSAPTKVFRAQIASLGVSVSDLESEPEEMTISPQYSRFLMDEWNSDIFSTPYYDPPREMWLCNFSFPSHSTLDKYEIRVRCGDLDGGYSTWNELGTPIDLLNNPPRVDNLSFGPSEVFRGNTSKIYLDVQDPESGAGIEDPVVEIRSPSSEWIPLTFVKNIKGDNFTSDFNTTADNEIGYYSLRIILEDPDGGQTAWLYYNSTLKVLNNPPKVAGDYIELGLYNEADRSEDFDLSEYASDFEEDEDENELVWDILESHSPLFSAVMTGPTILTLTPTLTGDTGEGMIRFRVTDKDGDVSYKNIYFELRDAEECPNIGVTLRSPADGIVISTTSIELSWDNNYTTPPTYKLYFGESEDTLALKEIIEGGEKYVIPDLYDGGTYFWKVNARFYDIPRTFESTIRSFSVDIDFKVVHDLEISFDIPNIKTMKKGDVITLNLTITNNGNVQENVRLERTGGRGVSVDMDSIVVIGPKEEQIIMITFTWNERLTESRRLTIEASYGEDGDESAFARITLEGKAAPKKQGSDYTCLWFAVIFIILLGSGIAIFVWRIKSRKDMGGEELEPSPFMMPLPEPPTPVTPGSVPSTSGSLEAPTSGSVLPPQGPSGPQPHIPASAEMVTSPVEPSEARDIQSDIMNTIELLKTLEQHKESLETDLIWAFSVEDKEEIKDKIAAIKAQQTELQARAIRLGEMARKIVSSQEELAVETTEDAAGPSVAETVSKPVMKALPAKTVPIETEEVRHETETGERKVTVPLTQDAAGEEEITKTESMEMSVTMLIDEIQELIEEGKRMDLELGAMEEKRNECKTLLAEGKVGEAEELGRETKIKLEELIETNLPAVLRAKIMEFSNAIDQAKEAEISVEDEADQLVVITQLKESGKLKEAISTLRGIHTSVVEKLNRNKRNIRSENIHELEIEMGVLELEGHPRLAELRAALDSAKESVEIDEFEAADGYVNKYNEIKNTPVVASAAEQVVEAVEQVVEAAVVEDIPMETAEEAPAATGVSAEAPAGIEVPPENQIPVTPTIAAAPTEGAEAIPSPGAFPTPAPVPEPVPEQGMAPKRRMKRIKKVRKVVKRRVKPRTQ